MDNGQKEGRNVSYLRYHVVVWRNKYVGVKETGLVGQFYVMINMRYTHGCVDLYYLLFVFWYDSSEGNVSTGNWSSLRIQNDPFKCSNEVQGSGV